MLQIPKATTVKELNQIRRELRDEEARPEWCEAVAKRKIKQLVRAYVLENQDVREYLLQKTEDKALIYASQWDKVMGTGFDYDSGSNNDPYHWEG